MRVKNNEASIRDYRYFSSSPTTEAGRSHFFKQIDPDILPLLRMSCLKHVGRLMTIGEISDAFGVSEEAIRRLERKALDMLIKGRIHQEDGESEDEYSEDGNTEG